nr:unnamed protein product [Callosobruchus analis]
MQSGKVNSYSADSFYFYHRVGQFGHRLVPRGEPGAKNLKEFVVTVLVASRRSLFLLKQRPVLVTLFFCFSKSLCNYLYI